MRPLEGQEILLLIICCCLIAVAVVTSCDADAGNLTIKTPLGTTIERVAADDAEAVAEAVGRADFMRSYADALKAPTVTSQCAPQVLTVNGTEVITMDCTVAFFDPRRLAVPPEFMTRPTRWADVANSFVGGTRDVAIAAVGASPYILAGYAVNQVRKGSGNNRTYNDSFNESDDSDNSNFDTSDHSTTDNSDNSDNSDSRTGYADGGSVIGDGRVGDDTTAPPTIVTQPPPIIVQPVFPDP